MQSGPSSFMQKMIDIFSEMIPDAETALGIAEGFSLVFSDFHMDLMDQDDLSSHVDALEDDFEFDKSLDEGTRQLKA